MHPVCGSYTPPRNAVSGMNRGGFTLIEVIVVLILLAILAAVAVPRIMDNTANEIAAANSLKAHLRFAQMQAMNSDTPWGIHSNGGGYVLFREGDTTDTAILPGEESVTVSPPRVTIPGFTVSFDGWGRPYQGADPASSTPANSNVIITIGSQIVAITPETGFIP